MSRIQRIINKWQVKTFPASTAKSKFQHLRFEIDELEDELGKSIFDIEKTAMEMADCVILLFGMAGLLRIDLLKYVFKKMKINRKREWKVPNSEGVYFHKET